MSRSRKIPRDGKVTHTKRPPGYDRLVDNSPEGDIRRRLSLYLLSVVEDSKSPRQRRDEMAHALAKVVATAPRVKAPREPKPATPSGGGKPRVSTYVSKKKQADAKSKTAQKGSPWDGLVNGSGRHEQDDEEDDE